MRIKSIELQNFLSFKSSKLELVQNLNEEPNIFIVDGINYDVESESEGSNGSGKSSLISESVFYNIYGRGLRGNKQRITLNDMIKMGCSRMSNNINYLFDGENSESEELNIYRTKSIKGQSSIEVNIDGEIKTKRTKKLSDKDIKMFINISPEVYSQIITYYKDNINLLSMNYGQRLNFFQSIIDISIIDNYFDSIKIFKINLEKTLDKYYLIKKNTEEILNIVDENKDQYIEYLNKSLENYNKKLTEAESITIDTDKEYKENIKQCKKELTENDNKIDDIQKNIIIAKNNIEKIEKEISKIKKLSGVDCPTCKQLVTDSYVDKISKSYDLELEKYISIRDTNIPLKKDAELYNKEIRKNIDDYNNKISEIDTKQRLKDNNIKTIKNEINKINKELLKASEPSNNKKIDRSFYNIKDKGYKNAIAILEKRKIAIEYWYNAFAPKSLLRSAIIRKYITVLSDTFEYYISRLYNNEIIGKIVIDDDGQIDPILYKNQYEINYFQLSSGERKRVDIAMMLSLYEFVSYLNPNIPQFLILDEIFNNK